MQNYPVGKELKFQKCLENELAESGVQFRLTKVNTTDNSQS